MEVRFLNERPQAPRLREDREVRAQLLWDLMLDSNSAFSTCQPTGPRRWDQAE